MSACRAWRHPTGVMDKRWQRDLAESKLSPWASATVRRKREGAGLRAELIERARTDQALIHPAALRRDLPECGQREGVLVHPGCLLWRALHHTAYRAPIGAACGQSRRCHLGTRAR